MPSEGLRMGLLIAGLVALFMLIRFGAILAERWVDISPILIAAVGYPILFFGFPILAYLFARQLDNTHAFAGAALGFTIAILLDYTYLGVTLLPLDVLVHRGGLAVGLGLIASGASYTVRHDPDRESFVQMGVLLWIVAMMLPLFRYVPTPF